MNRLQALRRAFSGAIHHRHAMARVALGLGSNRGWIAGRAVATSLDRGERRRAAAALLRDEDVVVRFEYGDLKWAIPSGDLILADMLADGMYESAEIGPLIEWVNGFRTVAAPPFVVEVGANVGTTTIPVCQQGFQVLAFEPVPRLRTLLEENIAANGFSSMVRTSAYAISNGHGESVLRVSGGGGSQLVADSADAILERRGEEYFFGRPIDLDGERNISVQTTSLDDGLSQHSIEPAQVAFVWSDTEGAETAVIQGGGRLWSDGVPLWVEIWPAGLDEHGGLDQFMVTIRHHFVGYVTRPDLLANGAAAPVRSLDELDDLLRSILKSGQSGWQTDLLLVPPSLADGSAAKR